ncbi:hypothetical protein GCM10023237_47720 [Streptomyces coeruleoprunus]
MGSARVAVNVTSAVVHGKTSAMTVGEGGGGASADGDDDGDGFDGAGAGFGGAVVGAGAAGVCVGPGAVGSFGPQAVRARARTDVAQKARAVPRWVFLNGTVIPPSGVLRRVQSMLASRFHGFVTVVRRVHHEGGTGAPR